MKINSLDRLLATYAISSLNRKDFSKIPSMEKCLPTLKKFFMKIISEDELNDKARLPIEEGEGWKENHV